MDAESLIASSSSRCTQCNPRQKQGTRNLAVCIDGTSNEFGQNNTNVIKLFQKIDLETTHPNQLAYYSSGIGTGPKPSQILNRIGRKILDTVDMAVAWNMAETIKEAYEWLAQSYQEGDQIYLFGFSRGAYQVRTLASMIHEVGLLRTPTEKQVRKAYDHFEAIRSGKPETMQIARSFKKTFSWKDLRVHFIGVWDTVSSVGLVRGNVSLSISSSADHACRFRHALALDELRVKFMPEYFYEMNSQTDDGQSKYASPSFDVEYAASPAIERSGSVMSDTSYEKRCKTTDIKEVWFAGSHSDVGGTNRPGRSNHAGNVPLLWMRREAAESGLVLQPTDTVWVPDDLDFGISDSMTLAWRAVEYVPIKHQVSFGGAGDDALRSHRLQPRRIIPGQKVHASILYAQAYKPQASLGDGFDIPVLLGELDEELDDQFWETMLFEDTAAQDLVAHMGDPLGVEPVCLDRLLFMLRFKEGRQCVRNVPNWQNQFMNLIRNTHCSPLVKLATIATYYEASCDPDMYSTDSAPRHVDLPQEVFEDAKKYLSAVLEEDRQRGGLRVLALLRPLTKHQILREHILTKDMLKIIMDLLDIIINEKRVNFGQAMDGLNSMLQCEDTRKVGIEKLEANIPYSRLPRLSQMLEGNDPRLLSATLRMMVTLARIPEARRLCQRVKPRLRELAAKNERVVGLPAVEILLSLYDPSDREQLNIQDANVRVNLAGALTHLMMDVRDSVDGQGRSAESGQRILRQLFGLDAVQLSELQQKLIGELKSAVQKGNSRERTGATFALLKICESEIVRRFLLQISLLDVFISQLKHRKNALLAAYALAACMKYSDMKESIKYNGHLPKHIVNMLRLDYFDDAVGQVEGFQIFGDFMQHADLREKVQNHNIVQVLQTKLEKGNSKETRTGRICLEIFRSFGTYSDADVGSH